jgi:hypothetical protein
MADHESLPSVEQVLALSLAAAGGEAWRRARTLRLAGEVAAGGLSGPFEQWVDLAGRRIATLTTLGPAQSAGGFDGVRAWQRSTNGEVVVQDADAARRMMLTGVWLQAHGWWFPQRWPAAIESLGRREADGRSFDVLRAEPDGGLPAELWFDAFSHRLARVRQDQLGKPSVRLVEEHRLVEGLLLPMRWTSGSGDARFDRVATVTEAQVDLDPPPAVFDVPVQRFADVSFVAGGRRATLPVTLANNHVFVDVELDGQALRFLLDTGGVNLVAAASAARIGLRAQGAMETRGPGADSVGSGFARVERLVVGGAVVLERQLLRVLDLGDLAAVEGVPIDGVLGVELFKRLVVQIDYACRELLLADPEDFEPVAGTHTLPLTFFGHFPGVDAELDGVAGQFWLDTGNRGGVILLAPFVREKMPAGRYATTPSTTIGWGIGGAASGRFARGGCLRLGGLRVEGPVLRLSDADDGVLAMRHVAGNIGGEVLRRFVVAFDYARRQVHLAPGEGASEPFEADRSGLLARRSAQGIVVAATRPGGPAQEAGLAAGDVIVAVDGEPAEAITLDALRRRLSELVTASLVLHVQREGEAQEVVLRLRDLIPAA